MFYKSHPRPRSHTRPVTAVWDPLELDNRWCFYSQGGKKQDLKQFPFKSRLNRHQRQHTPLTLSVDVGVSDMMNT